MSPVEHYLRKVLDIKPNTELMQELLNYIISQKYEPDYTRMLKYDGIVKLRNNKSYGYLYLNNENEVIFAENGIELDEQSIMLGYGIRIETSINTNGNISITLNACDGLNQYIIKVSYINDIFTGLFNNGKEIKTLSLEAFNELGNDIKNQNLLLTIMMNHIYKRLEGYLKANKKLKDEKKYGN